MILQRIEEEKEEIGGILTLANLALLLDIPGVQRRPLLVLHWRALVEVLGEVRLVEAGGLHHLPLRQVVLLHVALHHLGHLPRVSPGRRQKDTQAWCKNSRNSKLFKVQPLQFVTSRCSAVKQRVDTER